MNITEFIAILARLRACNESLAWLRALPPGTTAAEAWEACERGDWIVWLVGALHMRGLVTRQTLVLVACETARTALVHVPAGEDRPLVAIETAERWCRGEASLEEVRDAADDADAARADADAAADAAYAAYAAADAARAARAARAAYAAARADAAAYAAARADAAADAAYAAYAAADADADDAARADAARADAVRTQRRAEIAAAVRAVVPWATVETALRGVQP